jgi:hypothetical protein
MPRNSNGWTTPAPTTSEYIADYVEARLTMIRTLHALHTRLSTSVRMAAAHHERRAAGLRYAVDTIGDLIPIIMDVEGDARAAIVEMSVLRDAAVAHDATVRPVPPEDGA